MLTKKRSLLRNSRLELKVIESKKPAIRNLAIVKKRAETQRYPKIINLHLERVIHQGRKRVLSIKERWKMRQPQQKRKGLLEIKPVIGMK